MSLIIAHRDGWMVSDSRVTWDRARTGDFQVKKCTKIGNHTLIGQTGEWGLFQYMADKIQDCEHALGHSATVISGWLVEKRFASINLDVELVLVNRQRELLIINDGGALLPLPPSVDYVCIGSGENVAFGYLRALKDNGLLVTPEQAELAIAEAARRHTTVGGEVYVDRLV